ncbi:TPA: type II toxin-antitoxin system PemK/MazF family toxin [archaeon]|nr:type II toxin-antitoxin system PemK/MazF family toxin [Candidatus Naiadarchaeales archaeon SRR2090153.bin461]
MNIRRGDIVLVNLEPVVGSEQGKTRPGLIIQNDLGNEYSPTTIVAPITSKIFTKEFPTNVQISRQESGLPQNSTVLLNQIRTIDKSRIAKKLGKLNAELMKKINLAIAASLGLGDQN